MYTLKLLSPAIDSFAFKGEEVSNLSFIILNTSWVNLRFDYDSVIRVLEFKKEVRARIESVLDHGAIMEAFSDWHAKRNPIPCGMTIHTGISCDFGCLYCYIYDMGFTGKPKPYNLSGLQLVYALTVNPYFTPGVHGTLLAFGSVTEPFMDNTLSRTLEYFRSLRDYLGNPQQVSTKAIIPDNLIDDLRLSVDPDISILISLSTLRHADKLEPRAPPPESRLVFASKLIKRGFHVTLFLRPIIPSITDREIKDILDKASSYNIETIVTGTLRVTPRILKNLEVSRVVDINQLKNRIPENLKPRVQVAIKSSDLKSYIIREAEKRGIRILPASCSANIDSHRQACAACYMGPCGLEEKLPEVDEEGVIGACKALGVRVSQVRIQNNIVNIKCIDKPDKCRVLKHLIISLARRTPKIKITS